MRDMRGTLLAMAVIGASACGAPAFEPAPVNDAPADYYYTFEPLPQDYAMGEQALAPRRVELGRMLFFEPRLSASKELSCSSCHDLARYGADGRRVAIGHDGQAGTRNAPTVYNTAGYIAQFWDGRSPDVEDQAGHPILNPVEMAAASEEEVVTVLRSIPQYVNLFEAAFPDQSPAVTYKTMTSAIGAFERRLVTPGRFDAFLRGDAAALSAIERAGFHRFVELGCAGCHNGPELGGHSFEKLGNLVEWPVSTDLGRYDVTSRPEDRMRFRVPGLRNVAETAPYYHDGSIATLGDAVALMAKHQLGKTLSHEDHRSIVAFLRALSGRIPTKLIAKPTLPGYETEVEQ